MNYSSVVLLEVPVAPRRGAKRPRARLFVRAAERIGGMPVGPDALALFLRPPAYRIEIHARDAAVLHAELARDDHGVDVVAYAAFHDGLHRIAHGAHPQRAATGEID